MDPVRFEMISERWKLLVTFIWRMDPFRFELMYRIGQKPRTVTSLVSTTVNREHQHGAIDRIVAEIGASPGDVIPLLHALQKKFNYLPEFALRRICEITEITPAAVTGISTFYPQFRHTLVGQHIIHVCTGTACHVKGADLVLESFRRQLRIK